MFGSVKIASDKINRYLWFKSRAGIVNNNKLRALKNQYTGKRCFVMGNGPSLLQCDLTLLKDEITIASNSQFLIWDKMGYIPNFLTVEDMLVAEQRQQELNKIRETIKVYPKDVSHFLKPDEKTIYVNFPRKYKDFPKFSDDLSKIAYWGGTVSYLSLQLAYYLGCTEIYMIGFDHHYKNREKVVDSVITSEEDDVNHIHPDYFGKGIKWYDPNFDIMDRSFAEARKFLEGRNVKIFNATVGGKLEIFKRIDYNSLFKK